VTANCEPALKDAVTDRTLILAKKELSADHYYSARYVWYVVLLLAVVNVFNYMDRMALSVLAPAIKADLDLSDTQLGLLVGLAFSLFYAICGLPIARWADRGIRRDLITVALTIWSTMTAVSGAAQSFWHLLAARIGVGAGEAGCIPAAQSIICDYVPLKRRAGIFAIHSFGLYVGMMVGLMLAGWLSETIGWRWAFVALGLPGLVLAVIVRTTLREPIRGFFDAVNSENVSSSLNSQVAVLWRCKTYRLLVLLMIVNGFVQHGLLQWLPSFYSRIFGLNISSVGIYLGMVIGGGSAAGLLIGGFLADKAIRHNVKLPLQIGALATFMALPAALAVLFVPSAAASLLFMGLTGLFWSVSNGPAIAIINSVVTTRVRATAQAIAIFLTSVLGFGLGPLCVGALSDYLTPIFGVEALRYALLAPVIFLPVMMIALYAAAKTLAEDLRAVGAEV
jgi:predicted MFS family arabinose efflux permease